MSYSFKDAYEKYGKPPEAGPGKDFYQKEFENVIKATFKEFSQLKVILLQGYTPSFNDGDPCYHSGSAAFICTDGIVDPDYILESEIEEIEHSLEEDAVLIDELPRTRVPLGSPISSDVFLKTSSLPKEAVFVLNGVKFQKVVECLYYTNYIVCCRMNGEELIIYEEEYSCDW